MTNYFTFSSCFRETKDRNERKIGPRANTPTISSMSSRIVCSSTYPATLRIFTAEAFEAPDLFPFCNYKAADFNAPRILLIGFIY